MNTLALQYIERGRARRMVGYLQRMYPLPTRLASAALLSLSFAATLAHIHGLTSDLLSWSALQAVWNVFALGLVLRLMDELKDTEIDRQLFPDRPLPAGEISVSDIIVSLVVVCCGYMLANIGVATQFWMHALILGYTFLMFQRFFAPQKLQRSLLLTLVTHNPVTALMLGGLLTVFAVSHGITLDSFQTIPTAGLIAMFWALILSWEMARKIRCAPEEDAYVTYSQIFGRAGAVAIAWGVQTFSLGMGLYFCHQYASVWPFIVVAGAGYVNLACEYIHFLIDKSRTGSNLRPFSEAYMASIWFALLVAMVFCAR